MTSLNDGSATPGKEDGLVARMLETRTVLVAGQVDEKLAERVISQLLILNSINHDPIRMVITSQGGHVDSGFAIHDMMKFIESPVVSLGAGWVASIGVPILLGAEKDSRYSLPNTRFLLHQPSGGAGGQASDIRIAAEEILKLRERINRLIAGETGNSAEQVENDSDRNFWMNSEEALEYGLITKIVTSANEIG
jgi:ATP-dependent Clp protease protease subunit|tara:strand:+ start:77 stop:658 length:582 start_codon:yes stop_codon:yes gene_type:complete